MSGKNRPAVGMKQAAFERVMRFRNVTAGIIEGSALFPVHADLH